MSRDPYNRMQLTMTLTGVGSGGGPTGLRLTEEHRSIVIAKVRKGGKGDDAGLREGDVVLSVNGRSCQDAGASAVSQWIDNSSQKVTIQVMRGDSAAAADARETVVVEPDDLPAPTKIILRQEVQPEYTVTAPSGVNVQQNTDKSFTMTIGMPFQLDLGGETKGKQEEEEEDDEEGGGVAVCSDTRRIPPKQLEKILAEGIGSEPNTPDELPRHGKKLFVDSAFYDDPEHKYPTVEEQIQLARQVALSVISPANLKSKGHRMFMKRKERAIRWTTGLTDEEKADLAARASDAGAAAAGEPVDETASYSADQSPPSAMPTSVMFAPKLPKEKDEDRMNAMSNEELERMSLLERKTTHTNVSPQVCFSLVDDLKSMKGKGGKLFAKRQARAEKWDTEKSKGQEEEGEAVGKKSSPNRHSTDKLKVELRSRTNNADDDRKAAPTVNRLKEMIDAPKAAMTPWAAAAQYGSVEKAFEHLENAPGKQKSGQQSLADALQQPQRREGARGAIRPKSTIGGVGMGRVGHEDALGPEDRKSKIEALGGNPNAVGLASAMSASLVSAGGASKKVGHRSGRLGSSDPKNAAADHSANRNSTIGT